MFLAGGLEVLKNPSLYKILLIAGIVTWILNLVFLLDLKRGILTSFGTYLMYLTGHIYAIVGFSTMSGDYSFIGLKLSLPLICTAGNEGNGKERQKNLFHNKGVIGFRGKGL